MWQFLTGAVVGVLWLALIGWLAYAADTPRGVVAATEDTAERKLAEMRRAIALESTLTKDQILQRYLNITRSATAPTESTPPVRCSSANRPFKYVDTVTTARGLFHRGS